VREDGRVVTYDLARDELRDAAGVREKFGVDPDQIPDYLGLVGDGVDNLPGVPGVGPKSASAALRAFGRIEHIPADPLDWADVDIRGARRVAALIDEYRDRALRTRDLATVRRDVPGAEADLFTLAYRGADPTATKTLFEDLGWQRIAARIRRWAPR
jgi:5'-3' exonuclease